MKVLAINDHSKKPEYLDRVEDHDSFYIVRLVGSINASALAKGRKKMTAVINRFDLYSRDILCDLNGIEHADSASVAALIHRMADAKPKNKKLIFYNMPSDLQKIIDISRVSPLFRVASNEKDALASLDA